MLGGQRRLGQVVGAAFHDGPGGQTARAPVEASWASTLRPPARLAWDGHVARITTELADVALHPAQRGLLIHQPVVALGGKPRPAGGQRRVSAGSRARPAGSLLHQTSLHLACVMRETTTGFHFPIIPASYDAAAAAVGDAFRVPIRRALPTSAVGFKL